LSLLLFLRRIGIPDIFKELFATFSLSTLLIPSRKPCTTNCPNSSISCMSALLVIHAPRIFSQALESFSAIQAAAFTVLLTPVVHHLSAFFIVLLHCRRQRHSDIFR